MPTYIPQQTTMARAVKKDSKLLRCCAQGLMLQVPVQTAACTHRDPALNCTAVRLRALKQQRSLLQRQAQEHGQAEASTGRGCVCRDYRVSLLSFWRAQTFLCCSALTAPLTSRSPRQALMLLIRRQINHLSHPHLRLHSDVCMQMHRAPARDAITGGIWEGGDGAVSPKQA